MKRLFPWADRSAAEVRGGVWIVGSCSEKNITLESQLFSMSAAVWGNGKHMQFHKTVANKCCGVNGCVPGRHPGTHLFISDWWASFLTDYNYVVSFICTHLKYTVILYELEAAAPFIHFSHNQHRSRCLSQAAFVAYCESRCWAVRWYSLFFLSHFPLLASHFLFYTQQAHSPVLYISPSIRALWVQWSGNTEQIKGWWTFIYLALLIHLCHWTLTAPVLPVMLCRCSLSITVIVSCRMERQRRILRLLSSRSM